MLLPIVIRELRVSARNKATHRLRILFAVGAVAIGGGLGLLSMTGGVFPPSQLGIWIFAALKWIAFVFACAAGIFLTSDCLSEEKREGTLGLLFLTDLRGHDVVLGKLLATSLRTFYSLLAIFPVMAFSFVLGGVAADEFRHSLLSLCNTLFFSLALGMAISVLSRDPHKAMTGALGAMVIFLVVIPGLDWVLLRRNGNAPLFQLLSPAFAFTHASSYRAPDFWFSILLLHLAGWCCLAIASWLAPKTWQDKPFRPSPRTGWQFRLFGPAASRSSGLKLLDQNPVCWIISRDRWASNLARLALLLVLGVFALSLASLFQGPDSPAPVPGTIVAATRSTSTTTTTSTNGVTTSTTTVTWGASGAGVMARNSLFILASGCASALSLALEFWLAAHVCRFYVDGRRNGFLELLFVTPITQADILAGHWLALRRLFLPPAAALLFLTLACGAIQMWATSSVVVAAAPGGTGLPPASNRILEIQQVLGLVSGAISWGIGLINLVWFSIWMGLTSKKIPIAILKTFWYARILPLFGMTFAGILAAMFMATILGAGSTGLWPSGYVLLYIGVNLALIRFARRRAQAALSKWANSVAA